MMKLKLEQCVDKLISKYDYLFDRFPKTTNYIASAIGTVGGDIIAKQFSENPNVKLRDIIFTGTAAAFYSYIAPKMIELSTKTTNKISEYWNMLKNKTTHTVFNTLTLVSMYFPINMIYWNYLTIKNQYPITIEDNELGAITLAVASPPYFIADYFAIKKFSQKETIKYLRPFYSAVELLWNTIFAGGNYLAKKM